MVQFLNSSWRCLLQCSSTSNSSSWFLPPAKIYLWFPSQPAPYTGLQSATASCIGSASRSRISYWNQSEIGHSFDPLASTLLLFLVESAASISQFTAAASLSPCSKLISRTCFYSSAPGFPPSPLHPDLSEFYSCHSHTPLNKLINTHNSWLILRRKGEQGVQSPKSTPCEHRFTNIFSFFMRNKVIAGYLQLSVVNLIDESKSNDPTASFFDIERNLNNLPFPEVLISLDNSVAASVLSVEFKLSLARASQAILVMVTNCHLSVLDIDRLLFCKCFGQILTNVLLKILWDMDFKIADGDLNGWGFLDGTFPCDLPRHIAPPDSADHILVWEDTILRDHLA